MKGCRQASTSPHPRSESPPTPLFQVALETLLLRGPQKLRTHPLANYRYTGEGSVTAGVVWAWLGLLRSSQFPRQSLHVPRGVLGISHLPSQEGLSSLRGTPWALFSSRFLPSVHSFPPRLCLAGKGVPGRAGGRHSSPGVRLLLGESLNQWMPQLWYLSSGDGNSPYLLRFCEDCRRPCKKGA